MWLNVYARWCCAVGAEGKRSLAEQGAVGPPVDLANGVGRFMLITKETMPTWGQPGDAGWVGKLVKSAAKPALHFTVKFHDRKAGIRLTVAWLQANAKMLC